MAVPINIIDAVELVQTDKDNMTAAQSKLFADLAALEKLLQETYGPQAVGIVAVPGTPVTRP